MSTQGVEGGVVPLTPQDLRKLGSEGVAEITSDDPLLQQGQQFRDTIEDRGADLGAGAKPEISPVAAEVEPEEDLEAAPVVAPIVQQVVVPIDSPVTIEPPAPTTREQDIESLTKRIEDHGGDFADLSKRGQLVDENGNRIFTPEEERAMLETGVVSAAPDNRVHIQFNDQSWKDAVAQTVDNVRMAQEPAEEDQSIEVPNVSSETLGREPAQALGIPGEPRTSDLHAAEMFGQSDREYSEAKLPEEVTKDEFFAAKNAPKGTVGEEFIQKVEAIHPDWWKEHEADSLAKRISDPDPNHDYGNKFVDPVERAKLIQDGVFTPEEAEAMLETGVVSGAKGGAVVNFDEATGGKNWMQTVGETVDLVRGIKARESAAAEAPVPVEVVPAEEAVEEEASRKASSTPPAAESTEGVAKLTPEEERKGLFDTFDAVVDYKLVGEKGEGTIFKEYDEEYWKDRGGREAYDAACKQVIQILKSPNDYQQQWFNQWGREKEADQDVGDGLGEVHAELGLEKGGPEVALEGLTEEQKEARDKVTVFVNNARRWIRWHDANVEEDVRKRELAQARGKGVPGILEDKVEIEYSKKAVTKDGKISLAGIAGVDLGPTWNPLRRKELVTEKIADRTSRLVNDLFDGRVELDDVWELRSVLSREDYNIVLNKFIERMRKLWQIRKPDFAGMPPEQIEAFEQQPDTKWFRAWAAIYPTITQEEVVEVKPEVAPQPVSAKPAAESAPRSLTKEEIRREERAKKEREANLAIIVDAGVRGGRFLRQLNVDSGASRLVEGQPVFLDEYGQNDAAVLMRELGMTLSEEDMKAIARGITAFYRNDVAQKAIDSGLPEDSDTFRRMERIYSEIDYKEIMRLYAEKKAALGGK